MHIGFDGSRAFSKNKTGTENYSFQLLKALAKIDKKNNYLVFLRPGVKIEEDWPKNFQFKLINQNRLWTQLGLSKETFLSPIDLLFIPAHTLPLVYKKGLKTVVTVHDLGSQYLPQMHQVKQRLYLSLMQKYQLKSATKIIAVSEATKQDLITKIGLSKEKIRVVYEGFDKDKFKVQSEKLKVDVENSTLNSYGIDRDNYFLFVGTVQPRKNLERVIQAFNKYLTVTRGDSEEGSRRVAAGASAIEDARRDPELAGPRVTHLLIAGSKGWLSDEIYTLPEKLGIKARVKFLGYVPDKALGSLYRGAKALIFASLFEGFGLPIIEAQACGCPVITSNISSMKEIAGKGAILVDPYNIDDIVKGMEEVKSSKFKVQSLIKAGFENTKRFSWEKAAKETLKVFEEVGV